MNEDIYMFYDPKTGKAFAFGTKKEMEEVGKNVMANVSLMLQKLYDIECQNTENNEFDLR